MSEWKEYKLGDVAEVVGGGTPKTEVIEYWNGDVSWITPRDLSNISKKYISKGERSISKFGLENSNAKLLPKGTVLLSSRAPIGYLAIAGNEVSTNQGFQSLIPNTKTTTEFLFYLLKNNVDYLISQGSGTTFGELPKSTLKQIIFSFPPLPEQTAIATVLSSLDDKIDLLHRQNTTLEKMAETLFRQWFVEEAKEEWAEITLGNLGKIVCGKTPSKKVSEYFNGEIPFIKIPDMHGMTFVFDSEDSLTEQGLNSQKNKTIPPKSICVSCIATVGLVIMNAKTSQTNQQINSIIPAKDIYRYFIYLKMLSIKNDLLSMAGGGTATDNLNTSNFSKISIRIPNENELKNFHEQVKLIFEKIYSNQSQIRTLTALRDTLLPKLMSGDVRVL